MPIAHVFEYVKPATLDEAVAALATHGASAEILAGGTDLVGWLRDDLVTPSALVDIKGIPGLKDIRREGDVLSLGSLVTFTDLIDSAAVLESAPLLYEMARTVASTGIRNRATMVGNICSAVASCDAGPVLLVHEAEISVVGPSGARTIPAGEWFVGNKQTSLGEGGIVTGVTIPIPVSKHGAAYVKLGRYRGEDLAQASVAVLALPGDEYRVAFGAVGPTPGRASKIEAILKGKPLDDALMEQAKKLVPDETSPIADIRASAEYRALMLPVMLERGLKAAAARRDGTVPAYGTRFI